MHYALFYLQERGALFVQPGDKVYVGMIIGEHSRGADLDVNPIKEKKLTNIRAAGKDDAMLLIPPRRMSLEQAIAYVEDDELVEVTPVGGAPAQALPRPARAQAVRAAGSRSGGLSRRAGHLQYVSDVLSLIVPLSALHAGSTKAKVYCALTEVRVCPEVVVEVTATHRFEALSIGTLAVMELGRVTPVPGHVPPA